MPNTIKSRPICGSPVHSVFTGKDKYLRLQKHTISDITRPSVRMNPCSYW